MLSRIWKPTTASFGFGLFLAINATSIWGGAFPLLPTGFQTYDVMLTFSIVELCMLIATFLFSLVLSFYFPRLLTHQTSVLCGPFMCAGAVCLIAPLYLPEMTLLMVVVGGLLLGFGSALFFLSWHRLFASQAPEKGLLDLVVGLGLSAVLYVAIHFIPNAIAAFTIPLIFVPLSEVCLIRASRAIDFEQPMFTDLPFEHGEIYRHLLHAQWRNALCVGAFGFASGIARAIALESAAMGVFVNYFQMGGALISATILIGLWRNSSFKFDTIAAFRIVFPVIVTLFLLLPYLGGTYLRGFSGIMYAFFSFALMIMMVQCAQASRDNGTSPTFIYGFFAGIVYLMQGAGFVLGYVSRGGVEGLGDGQLSNIALMAIWLLAITMHLVRNRNVEDGIEGGSLVSRSNIEFIALKPRMVGSARNELCSSNATVKPRLYHSISKQKDTHKAADAHDVPLKHERHMHEDGALYKDRLSKQCGALAKRYFLSSRETEVMELIARGNAIGHIAKMLYITENTVKTYNKRIYIKLDIHSRQGLLSRLEEAEADLNAGLYET